MGYKEYLNEQKKISKNDFMSLHKANKLGVVQGFVKRNAKEIFKLIKGLDKNKIENIRKNSITTTRANVYNEAKNEKTIVYEENIHGVNFFVVETVIDNSKDHNVSWDTIETFSTIYMEK